LEPCHFATLGKRRTFTYYATETFHELHFAAESETSKTSTPPDLVYLCIVCIGNSANGAMHFCGFMGNFIDKIQ